MEEYKCTKCNRTFPHEKALNQHTKHKHKHESDTELIQTKPSTGPHLKFALIIVGVVIIFAILVFVVYPSISSTSTPNTNNLDQVSSNLTSQNQEVIEIRMTAKRWQFEPATITVNQGDKVKLLITSIDVAHGIAIPHFGINQRLSPGQTTTIEFVANQRGNPETFCSTDHGEKLLIQVN